MFLRGGIWAAIICGALVVAKTSNAQTPELAPEPATDVHIQKIIQSCFQCHGPNGISKISSRPTIAGQKGNYIAQQLTFFLKAAKRQNKNLDEPVSLTPILRLNPVMEHAVEGLDAQTIVKVASTLSALACRQDDAKLKTSLAPPDVVKSCVMCHGTDGLGIQINTPNLAGQQRAYLRRELLLIRETAWGAKPRKGETARNHPIMESQVARLKIQDVDALAEYYSALDCRGRGSQ